MPGAQADHGAPKKLGHEEMLCVTSASEPGLLIICDLPSTSMSISTV